MNRPLRPRERECAIALIRYATTSPDEDDYSTFNEEQKRSWGRPEPITAEQRELWESNLGEVVVTSHCECGECPTIGMRQLTRVHDEQCSDRRREGDFARRVVLDAAVEGAMIQLFIDDDSPSCLELAPIEDGIRFEEFPPSLQMAF